MDELAASVERDEPLPAGRLRAAIELGRELSDLGDALIGRYVDEARTAGLSWTEIGQAFGTSKQAVQQRYGAEPGRWPGRWTPAAREALTRAGEESQRLRHGYVGTEHVLLALADSGVLRELGVTRERMLATRCLAPGERETGDCVPLMPRLKQAVERSRRIADGLDAHLAGTEHLLAGLTAVPDSMAVEILRRLGVSAADVRAALAARLGVEPERLGAPRRRRRRLLAAGR
jgi:hypothetical protein